MAVTCTGSVQGTFLATLQGQGQNVAIDHTLGFSWGTVLGGPYPNATPHATIGTNVAAQNYDEVITGLASGTTYYFVALEYDNADAIVDTSDECTFVAMIVNVIGLACSGPCAPNEAVPLPPVIAPPCMTCEELQAV